MVFTPVEIVSLLVACLILIKILVILINKKVWYETVVKPIYGNINTRIILIILAIIVFYYLIKELTIVQIFASFAFFSLLMGASLVSYSKDMLIIAKKAYSQKLDYWEWFYIILFATLSLWVLLVLFS